MAGDDFFTRYLEIGASLLGMTRERAEAIVRDLVASGEMAKSQATKAADRLVDRGKAASEELSELVRREIRQQVSALGLATQADVARLEAQIEELKAAPAAPQARSATKPAPARKRTGAAPPAGGAEPPKG